MAKTDSNVGVTGACYREMRARAVEESPGQVVLRLQSKGPYVGDCIGYAEATLRLPLGDRVVIDATTGAPAAMHSSVDVNA